MLFQATDIDEGVNADITYSLKSEGDHNKYVPVCIACWCADGLVCYCRRPIASDCRPTNSRTDTPKNSTDHT